MLFASISAFCLLLFLHQLWPSVAWAIGGVLGSYAGTTSGLGKASALFRELEELLAAGLLPATERWEQVRFLDSPWGPLADSTLKELRSRGGQVLPTLRRLRDLVDAQAQDLREGRARSSAALSQALVCSVMVPCLSGALYLLLPGLGEHRAIWLGITATALSWSGVGAIWLIRMAESARWGGLQGQDRPALLAAYCAGERLLALLRSGQPPDLAWQQSVGACDPGPSVLGRFWKASLWASEDSFASYCEGGRALTRAGGAIRRAVQCALLEGRPCAERIESAIQGLRLEMRAAIERELSLLATRALKPLFFCVAPALILLITSAILVLWGDSSGGSVLGF